MKTLAIILLFPLLPIRLSPVSEELAAAGRLVDRLYLRQAAGSCLQLLPGLRKEKRELFLFNFGPFSRTGGKFFLEDCHCLPGCGNYPPDLDLQALKEAMKEDETGELRIKLNSPLTVILQEEGGFRAVPYHEFYKVQLKELSEQLQKIKTSDPSLNSYLRVRARELLTDRFEQGDELWLKIKGKRKVYFGPVEVEDPYLKVKMAYGGVVFDLLPWKFADSLPELLSMLQKELPSPWGGFSPFPYPGLRLARLIQAYGKFKVPPAPSFAVLPPFLPSRARKYLFLNVLKVKFDKALSMAGGIVYGWKGDLEAYLYYLALHDLAHFLSVSERRKSRLLSEIFADSAALKFLPLIKKREGWEESMALRVVHSYLASLLYYSAKGKKPAVMQLNYLLSRGAIKMRRDGKIEIVSSFHKVVSSMWKVALEALQGKGEFPGRSSLSREIRETLKPLGEVDFYLEFNKIN